MLKGLCTVSVAWEEQANGPEGAYCRVWKVRASKLSFSDNSPPIPRHSLVAALWLGDSQVVLSKFGSTFGAQGNSSSSPFAHITQTEYTRTSKHTWRQTERCHNRLSPSRPTRSTASSTRILKTLVRTTFTIKTENIHHSTRYRFST